MGRDCRGAAVTVLTLQWQGLSRTLCSCTHVNMYFQHLPSRSLMCIGVCVCYVNRVVTNSLQLRSCIHVVLALTLMCIGVCIDRVFTNSLQLRSCGHVFLTLVCTGVYINKVFKDSMQLRSCIHVAEMQTCRYLLVVLTSSTHQQYLLVVLTSSTHQQYLLVVLSSGTYLQYLVVVPIAVVPSTTSKYHYQVLLDRKTVNIRVQCSDVALE